MTERDKLREHIKNLRSGMSALHSMTLSARICERVIMLPEYLGAKRVFCYRSLPMEVQTGGLLREILRTGRELYLPVTVPGQGIRAVRLENPDAVHKGYFSVMEPDGGEEIDPRELDLILTPGLAFDLAGGRIGYGGGYFDRFLPACRGAIVALAYEMQLVDRVPMEAHDWRVQQIVTEENVYRCVWPDSRKSEGEKK